MLPDKLNKGIDWLCNNMPSDKHFAKGFKYVSNGEREIVFLNKWLNVYAKYENEYPQMQNSIPIKRHALRSEHLRQIQKEQENRHRENCQQFRTSFQQWLHESN